VAVKDGNAVRIDFTADPPTDVATTVEDANGKVVRHLVADGFRKREAMPERGTARRALTRIPLLDAEYLEMRYLTDALRDDTRTPVPNRVAFRMDFVAWRAVLTKKRRRMLDALAAGARRVRSQPRSGCVRRGCRRCGANWPTGGVRSGRGDGDQQTDNLCADRVEARSVAPLRFTSRAFKHHAIQFLCTALTPNYLGVSDRRAQWSAQSAGGWRGGRQRPLSGRDTLSAAVCSAAWPTSLKS
jgi:hypothetical protein